MALSALKNNILKFNQYMKSDKSPWIIFADLNNNLKKFSTAKIGEHIFGDIQCKIYGHLIL